jgi:hypothetical protein
VKTENGASEVTLDQAQCALTIMPSHTSDGRTRLKFTPQVLHGDHMPEYQVDSERKGFVYECKRPTKAFDALSWEVNLAPNQFLVLGTYFDENADEGDPQSLGNCCFLIDNGRTFTQRLLVIRTTRGEKSFSLSGRDNQSEVINKGAGFSLKPGDGILPMTPAAHCLLSAGR